MVGGGGMAEHDDSAVVGGGGMAEHEDSAVAGGGGMNDPERIGLLSRRPRIQPSRDRHQAILEARVRVRTELHTVNGAPLTRFRQSPGARFLTGTPPLHSPGSSEVHITTRVRSPRNRSLANSSGSPERA